MNNSPSVPLSTLGEGDTPKVRLNSLIEGDRDILKGIMKEVLTERDNKWYHRTAVKITVATLMIAFSSALAVIAIILSNNVKTEVDSAQIQILEVQASVNTAQNQVTGVSEQLGQIGDIRTTLNQLSANATVLGNSINVDTAQMAVLNTQIAAAGNISQRLANVEKQPFIGFTAATGAGFAIGYPWSTIHFPDIFENNLGTYGTWDGVSMLTVNVGGVWEFLVGGSVTGDESTVSLSISGQALGPFVQFGTNLVYFFRAYPGDSIFVQGICSSSATLGGEYQFILQVKFIGY